MAPRVLDLRQPVVSVKTTPASRALTIRLPRWKAFEKRANLALVGLILLTITIPVLETLITRQRYVLNQTADQLLGSRSPKMTQKITYDEKSQKYQFNKQQQNTNAAAEPSKSVGAGDESRLYSADLFKDSSKGVTVYDNVNKLSFGLTPQFKTLEAKQQDNRLIYPLQTSTPQLVYSAQANGIKEDIVLNKSIGDKAEFKYNLNLNSQLEARIVNGGVGVYSADPTLFGNISFGSDADREKVEAARKNGNKTNLVFYLPAPVIKQSANVSTSAQHDRRNPAAEFRLEGNTLTLVAIGLKQASYPLSIDPSIVVTSSSDFRTGNNEGGIEYDDSNNQIKRSALSGGSVGSWTSGTSFTTARHFSASAIYNGFIYLLGGCNTPQACNTWYSDVQYASLNASTGAIGTWNTTTSLPSVMNSHAATAYNGYMYVVGGSSLGAGAIYAKIKSDGTLGSWITASNMTANVQNPGAIAAEGYLYSLGGNSSTVVQYAQIKADGSLGTWTATTSFSGFRGGLVAAYNNGYIYAIAGYNTSTGFLADTLYAKVNSNGSLGSWTSGSSLSTGITTGFGGFYNGYLYYAGGRSGANPASVVNYAPLNADGSVGTWRATTAMINARAEVSGGIYNGYLYALDGCTAGQCTSVTNTVEYAKINPAGVLHNGAWSTSGNLAGAARLGLGTVVYNGYIYAIGGSGNGSSTLATVDYAAIGTDGNIGTWATTSSLATARSYTGAVAYNGFIYAVGGCSLIIATQCQTSLGSTDYVAVNTNGTLGTWTTDATHNLVTARTQAALTIYNGYIYIAGGNNNANTVEYVQLNANGTLNNWTQDTDVYSSIGRGWLRMSAWNGFLYVSGGNNGATNYSEVTYSQIGSSGNPGTWAATSSMIKARTGHGMVAWNGYMYVYNGDTDSSQTTEYARIKSDGTLDAWTTTQSSPNARYYFGSAASNGVVYAVGGYDNGTGYQTNATYQYINNGGSGGTSSWTTDSTNPFTARKEFGAVAYNGYVYISGGCTDTAGTCASVLNTVQYAPINDDGSLGTWTSYGNFTPSSGTGLYRHAMTVYNGYLYITGGQNTSAVVTDVLYSKIAAGGGVDTAPCGTAWCASSTFTTARRGHSVIVDNGKIYLTGGLSSAGSLLSDVQYATLSSNGTVGSWSSSTSFTTARYIHASVAYNGFLYILGGCTSTGSGCNTGTENDVQYAQLNPSGGITGSWLTAERFPGVRYQLTAAAYNGHIYVAGGSAAGTHKADTLYAAINTNGSLSSWNKTTNFTTARFGHASFVANGRIYCLGGQSGTPTVLNTAEYATLQSIPRIGRYSKLFDMDKDVSFTKLVANGSLLGAITAKYQTATDSNTVFGSAASVTPTLGSLLTLNQSEKRYAWLHLTLDDSSAATFPDANTTPTTISDIELFYNPNPGKRLRGGKTFTTETKTGLDAQPQ